MTQSSCSSTSLWLLLLGGLTLLFTHCLLCWFDNLSLWPNKTPPLLSKQEALSPVCLALRLIHTMKSRMNTELQNPACFFLLLSLPAVFSPVSNLRYIKKFWQYTLACIETYVSLSHLICMRNVHSCDGGKPIFSFSFNSSCSSSSSSNDWHKR